MLKMITFERVVAWILLVTSVAAIIKLLTVDHGFRQAAFPVSYPIGIAFNIMTIVGAIGYYTYLIVRKNGNED